MKVKVDVDLFDAPIATAEQTIESYPVVSIGEFEGNTVVTFCRDPETREYATIETGSVFFHGFEI